jgi:hypothetical protein
MKSNISIGECIIRIVAGMIFAGVMVGLTTGWVAMIGLLAIYPIVTGLGGWDPIFGALGKYTNEDSPYEEEEIAHATPTPLKSRADINTAA